MGAFCNGEGTVMGAARDDAAMVLLSPASRVMDVGDQITL
jgi:hypothetical protein